MSDTVKPVPSNLVRNDGQSGGLSAYTYDCVIQFQTFDLHFHKFLNGVPLSDLWE